METAIREMGNSRGVIIPKPLLAQTGLENEAEMIVENGAIVLRRAQRKARAGWAETSKAIAEAGDDVLMWLAALDPTVSSEIQKTRSCVVIFPPEMYDYLRTVIVAPMATGSKPAPFRVAVVFDEKMG